MTRTTKISIIYGVIATIVIISLLFLNKWEKDKTANTEQFYSAVKDSLNTVRNELNQEITKTTVIQSENTKLLLSIETKDSTLYSLQNVIRKYEKENGKLNTALVLSNETVIRVRDSLRNAIVGHTTDPVTNVTYPIYTKGFNRDWDSGTVTMGYNYFDLELKVKNNYEITIGNDKVNLVTKKYYANVTNLNPNTETKSMKVYQTEPIKDYTIYKIGIFAGLGLILGLLIN